MLQQIISHTPLYVWAILAFLVHRGMAMSADRELSIGRLFIVPMVMLALSFSGVTSSFGASTDVLASWLIGLLAGTAASWHLTRADRFSAQPARGTVVLRGSWMPLVLMLTVFVVKFALAITVAVAPALRAQSTFVICICIALGAFTGIFAGRLARSLAVYHQASLSHA